MTKTWPMEVIACPICLREFSRRVFDGRRGFCLTCSGSCGQQLRRRKFAENFEIRFWDKVSNMENPHQCWPWKRSVNKCGYGTVGYQEKTWLAHRLAYVFAISAIPDGQIVCHTCDNPPCCNPAHLWLGTPLENTKDSIAKSRFTRASGEANGLAKLDADKVRTIRTRHAAGENTRAIASDLAIDRSTVYKVLNGRAWRSISF